MQIVSEIGQLRLVDRSPFLLIGLCIGRLQRSLCDRSYRCVCCLVAHVVFRFAPVHTNITS